MAVSTLPAMADRRHTGSVRPLTPRPNGATVNALSSAEFGCPKFPVLLAAFIHNNNPATPYFRCQVVQRMGSTSVLPKKRGNSDAPVKRRANLLNGGKNNRLSPPPESSRAAPLSDSPSCARIALQSPLFRLMRPPIFPVGPATPDAKRKAQNRPRRLPARGRYIASRRKRNAPMQ